LVIFFAKLRNNYEIWAKNCELICIFAAE